MFFALLKRGIYDKGLLKFLLILWVAREVFFSLLIGISILTWVLLTNTMKHYGKLVGF
jgi:hypothetical protein